MSDKNELSVEVQEVISAGSNNKKTRFLTLNLKNERVVTAGVEPYQSQLIDFKRLLKIHLSCHGSLVNKNYTYI